MINNSINAENPVLQFVYTSTATYSTITSGIDYDDTIPQNTDGSELFTLSITPFYPTSLLEIDVFIPANLSDYDEEYTVALFQDTTANALSAVQWYGSASVNVSGLSDGIRLKHIMTSGTTSSTTFKVRLGCDDSADSIYINGDSSGRIYGGVQTAYITIKEILE